MVTSRLKIPGYPTHGRMTNVYVKRQGRWQCVASHASGMAGATRPVADTPVVDGSSDDTLQTMKLVFRIYYADAAWRETYGIANPDETAVTV